MPIYEYQCEECGHKFEVMQRLSEDRLKTCPSCAADALKKLISKVDFRLKGTGWYETDFKNQGKPTSDKDAETGGAEDNEGKNAKKDEGKTESSADVKSPDKDDSNSTPTTRTDD